MSRGPTAEHDELPDGAFPTRVNAVYGAVSAGWRELQRRDPEFAEVFLQYVETAHNAPSLPASIRELLLLAHDVSMTTFDETGIANRMESALDAGATEREILDVIELLSMLSIHSLVTGLDLAAPPEPPPASRQGPYWHEFEERFPGFHGALASTQPEFFGRYEALGKALWRPDGLAPQWKELVFVVADLSTTHLFRDGAAIHIANARSYGATASQVIEAIILAIPPGSSKH